MKWGPVIRRWVHYVFGHPEGHKSTIDDKFRFCRSCESWLKEEVRCTTTR